MRTMYNEFEIRPMPLSSPFCRRQVEDFLAANGLRLDDVDYYAAVFSIDNDERILAGGGLKGNVIRCIAVAPELRDEGFSSRLVSHLLSEIYSHHYTSARVFTKPGNQQIFENLGFHIIGKAPEAILMENGTELRSYCNYLSSQRRLGESGVIVMNANPFTLGHRYLIEQASQQVTWLHVVVVKEDCSEFPYAERIEMIRRGTRDLTNVNVCEGSDYSVSQTTFPTYFLKKLSSATDNQIRLDLDVFVHFIAPHLGIHKRFIGSEPTDPLTNRYNQLIHEVLPTYGYGVVEIPRLGDISASTLRHALAEGKMFRACSLAYPTTLPFLFAHQVCKALTDELDTTPKPGLVDRTNNGAHRDMDYRLMQQSIAALRPYFARLCEDDCCHDSSRIRQTGMAAEAAMLGATHGVNTHRGALFALGITAAAAAAAYSKHGCIATQQLQAEIRRIAATMPRPTGTHGAEVERQHGKGGALAAAQGGYATLFEQWLPYYASLTGDPHRNHKTLLCIMASLDDTNVYHRGGSEAAEWVKEQAADTLQHFSPAALSDLDRLFVRRNISPGGSADMLSLTIFIHLLTAQA